MSLNDTNALAGIRAHHLFAGLTPAQLQHVLSTAYIEEAESGQLLFDRGQPAMHFYVVLEGQVNLLLYSKTGEEKIVDILGPGQSFAEAVMFMSGPAYPVSAMAASRARIAKFSSADYLAILRESPETCLRMLGHLSQRLHMRIREIEYLTLESATHRLVRMIDGRLPVDPVAGVAAGDRFAFVDETRDPVPDPARPVRQWCNRRAGPDVAGAEPAPAPGTVGHGRVTVFATKP
jgi:CRP-like cAMP-binding protein